MRKKIALSLPIFLAIIALAVFAFRFLLVNPGDLLTCFNKNGCRVVSTRRTAVVKIDGVESPGSKVFEDEENFYLVSDFIKKDDFSLTIINKFENDAMYPIGCYGMVSEGYLILPDCAASVFYGNKGKADGFDTQLTVTGAGLTFLTPEKKPFNIPEHRIEIVFQR